MAMVVFALAAAAAFFLALVGLDVLRRAFVEYRRHYVARSIRDLGDMFLFVETRQVLVLNLLALGGCAAAGLSIGGPFLAAVAAVAGFFAPSAAVRVYRRRRIRRFEAQLTEALLQVANALRAGLALPQALEQAGREADAPLHQEFGLFTKEVKLGVPVEEALGGLASRVGSEDLELVVTAANIARQLGGNLAETFETIAETIRERFRLEGRIAALTSQGKLQGLVVAALPLAVGLFLGAYRPDLIGPMFESAYGYVLVSAIALLQAIGFLLVRRIVTIDV
ncbi:MAG TPA: type II secretion system F family protein [Gaiellales bacterium]|nr:type II secretion system F family protein [Gaiellales bacterium]HZX93837.1 type II secretion system F family protein [Myxococcales bacterium]